jgi:predicted nucleotidyltransferase
MNKKVKNELDNIVAALVGTGIVSQIFLFGSYAKGEENANSDIDLCVLTPINDRHPVDITVDLRMKLYDIQKMPLDLLTYNQDSFFYHAKRPTSFEHEIAKNGVVLKDCIAIY